MLLTDDGTRTLAVYDVATDQSASLKVRIDIGYSSSITPPVLEARWLGATRLLLASNLQIPPEPSLRSPPTLNTVIAPPMTINEPQPIPQVNLPYATIWPRGYSGFTAIGIDGKSQVNLPGFALRTDFLPRGAEPPFVWDSRRMTTPSAEPGVLYAPAYWGPPGLHPDLARIDTVRDEATAAIKNPGHITEWLISSTGRVVLGINGEGRSCKILARDKSVPGWIEVADLGLSRKQLHFHSLDPDRSLIYASRVSARGRWEPTAYSLQAHRWLEPLVSSERYDIAGPDYRGDYANVDLGRMLFSPKTGNVLAIGFVSDGPRQNAFDERLKEAERQLQATAPGLTSCFVEIDDTEKQVLALAWSDRQPGFFSLINLATHRVTRIADRMPWLNPIDLGEMLPARIKARDGTELDVYVTPPPGPKKAGPLPMVVLLRDHPWQRDIWGFQPLVQFLATRGYVVLQVNHRGSSGYGVGFAEAGYHGVGTLVQDDIADAVRWAVARHLADPQRIGIVGTSFGGYCALMALGRDGDLFRCGVAIDAVTDWWDIFHRDEDDFARRYWFATMGLLPTERSEAQLRALSPLTMIERIHTPLLLVHNESERRSPFRSVRTFAAALKKSGHAPETYFFDTYQANAAVAEETRIAVYTRVVTFLAKHLTPAPTVLSEYGQKN